MKVQRNARGNMLFLVVLSAGLIIGSGMMGFMFNRFLSHKEREQGEMDATALRFASAINVRNRVGQLNELQQGSRELVFLSRDRYDKCQTEDSSFLAPLCYQLLTEARAGHELVERERQHQIKLISTELQQATRQFNDTADGTSFTLSWPKVSHARIEDVYVGSIKNTDSNVRNLDVITKLVDFDRGNGYINSRSNLYKADINAKLPNEGDLNFFFSSLPANVEGTCSPARNVNPEVFASSHLLVKGGTSAGANPTQIPNAVQIHSSISASASNDANGYINIVSTGVTNGDSSSSP